MLSSGLACVIYCTNTKVMTQLSIEKQNFAAQTTNNIFSPFAAIHGEFHVFRYCLIFLLKGRGLFSIGFGSFAKPYFRLQRVPSQACWVLCEVGKKPFSPVAVCHMSAKLRHKMLQRLRSRERRVHDCDWPAIDESLVEYIVSEVRCYRNLFGAEMPQNVCPLGTNDFTLER